MADYDKIIISCATLITFACVYSLEQSRSKNSMKCGLSITL